MSRGSGLNFLRVWLIWSLYLFWVLQFSLCSQSADHTELAQTTFNLAYVTKHIKSSAKSLPKQHILCADHTQSFEDINIWDAILPCQSQYLFQAFLRKISYLIYVFSIKSKGLVGIEQDTKTHSSADGNFGSYFEVVVGDDAFSYSNKGGRGLIDPLFHFCISCAVCRRILPR